MTSVCGFLVLISTLVTLLTTPVFAQEQVEGAAIMRFTNSKDIYHPLNEEAKFKLMQSAIFDAIEKGSTKKISVVSYSKVTDSGTSDNHFDTFISTTLQKSGVSWKRTSDYHFQLIGRREWKCNVTGLVKALEVGDSTNVKDTQDFPRERKVIVTKRGINMVHINSSLYINYGQIIGIGKHVKAKVLNDYDSYVKIKALVFITEVGNDFSVGRIIKGFYGVKVGDAVVIRSDFKTNRMGVKFDCSPITPLNPHGSALSIGLFTQSYVNRFGVTLNCDLLQHDVKPQPHESGYLLIPNAGVNYHLALLPDLLYVVPEANVGYVVKAKTSDVQTIMLNPKLGVSIRIKYVEILAGAQYRFFLDKYYAQSGLYPFASINFSLNKN